MNIFQLDNDYYNNLFNEVLLPKTIKITSINGSNKEVPIPSFIWNKSIIPNIELLENEETGLENKFGGYVPLFLEGDKWPMIKVRSPTIKPKDLEISSNNIVEIPMTFIAQFVDPQNLECFCQIFSVDFINRYNLFKDYLNIPNPSFIRFLSLNEVRERKIIKIKKPSVEGFPNNDFFISPEIINKWYSIGELDIDNLQKLFNIKSDDSISLNSDININQFLPYQKLKLSDKGPWLRNISVGEIMIHIHSDGSVIRYIIGN